MPRYYFHTEDGECFADADGLELPDLDAAKAAALKYLREMLWSPREFWRDGRFRVIVTDGEGLTLFTLDLSAEMADAEARGAREDGEARCA
jgi:hypothetical protein